MNNNIVDLDDVGQALAENRPLKLAREYKIFLARGGVDFRPVMLSDPVPTGRQILVAAGLDDREDFTLCAILTTGDFEEVSLNETFDLRGREVYRFIAFLTDRLFKFTLDGRQMIWGQPVIQGEVLYALSEIGTDKAVFLEVRGGTDRLLEPADNIDLTQSGVEHFITAPRTVKGYVIAVNSINVPVPGKLVTFKQVVQIAYPNGSANPNVRYAVTFRHAASIPHSGDLAEGGSVEVQHNGTIFNVANPSRS